MLTDFEIIFKAYFNPVHSFVNKLVKSETDAEDITQDVFTQLWDKPEIWQSNPEIDRYLFRMAKNKAFDYLRTQASHFDRGLIDAPLHLVELVSSDIGTIDHIIHTEANILLRMALDRMPPRRRQIFIMSRYENLSNKEIADRLGLSIRTVESHIHSALCTLRTILHH